MVISSATLAYGRQTRDEILKEKAKSWHRDDRSVAETVSTAQTVRSFLDRQRSDIDSRSGREDPCGMPKDHFRGGAKRRHVGVRTHVERMSPQRLGVGPQRQGALATREPPGLMRRTSASRQAYLAARSPAYARAQARRAAARDDEIVERQMLAAAATREAVEDGLSRGKTPVSGGVRRRRAWAGPPPREYLSVSRLIESGGVEAHALAMASARNGQSNGALRASLAPLFGSRPTTPSEPGSRPHTPPSRPRTPPSRPSSASHRPKAAPSPWGWTSLQTPPPSRSTTPRATVWASLQTPPPSRATTPRATA